MSTVSGFTLKLERAYEHLNNIKAEAKTWIDADPYEIVDEVDPNPPPKYLVPTPGDIFNPRRFRVRRVTPVPVQLSILIGDCVFNLRSALDHLALALAKAHTPGMSEKQVKQSEFPIFNDHGKYRSAAKQIACVAPHVSRIIESLQPYHRGDDFIIDPLWKIHDLNIVDKHRMLTVCGAEPRKNGARVVGITPENREEAIAWQYMLRTDIFLFELNAIWVQWSPVGQSADQSVNVKLHAPVEIVFGNGGPARLEAVIPTLQSLCDFVRDNVIHQLATFL